jgi:hypothetical protein
VALAYLCHTFEVPGQQLRSPLSARSRYTTHRGYTAEKRVHFIKTFMSRREAAGTLRRAGMETLQNECV